MRKLLVPVDDSDNSMRALRHAISLARENGPASIHIVTAHEQPDIYGEIAVYVSRQKMEELQRLNSEAVLEAAERVLNEAAVPYTKEILIGPIAHVIAERADSLGCDGIVMGTRGLTAIGSALMGSIAMKVVHAANIPVTLVK